MRYGVTLKKGTRRYITRTEKEGEETDKKTGGRRRDGIENGR